MSDADPQIHEAFEAALRELAIHLGGSTEDGGPVENMTQIEGREELGVLLTDRDDRVLGRVWIAFGAAVQAPELRNEGNVAIQAEVCSEVQTPPVSIESWFDSR